MRRGGGPCSWAECPTSQPADGRDRQRAQPEIEGKIAATSLTPKSEIGQPDEERKPAGCIRDRRSGSRPARLRGDAPKAPRSRRSPRRNGSSQPRPAPRAAAGARPESGGRRSGFHDDAEGSTDGVEMRPWRGYSTGAEPTSKAYAGCLDARVSRGTLRPADRRPIVRGAADTRRCSLMLIAPLIVPRGLERALASDLPILLCCVKTPCRRTSNPESGGMTWRSHGRHSVSPIAG